MKKEIFGFNNMVVRILMNEMSMPLNKQNVFSHDDILRHIFKAKPKIFLGYKGRYVLFH